MSGVINAENVYGGLAIILDNLISQGMEWLVEAIFLVKLSSTGASLG